MLTPLRSLDFTALVVEDDPQFTRAVEQALAQLGRHWQSLCVSTGHQAMQVMQDQQDRWIDLVLVDLGLPDMHGVEVIRAAHLRWPQTPILVSTVHRGASDVLAAIEAGARGYVDKSDTAMTLSRAIDNVLQGEYPISASLAQHLFKLVPRLQATQAPSTETPLLSPRELELLRLLGDGYTYEETSERMGVSLNTVQTFSRRIFQKLEVRSKVQAINAAQVLGLM